MRFTPLFSKWEGPLWIKWLLTVAATEALWFGFLWPLIPKTLIAGIVEAALVLPTLMCFIAFEQVANWSAIGRLHPVTQKVGAWIGVFVLLGLITVEVYAAVHFLNGQWKY